ncbi:uncharacterized protein LOC117172770 [Belonocnema kinseyi]|uniref:uncharacterized protein LOC117172770 n=1 Tax=Belonocnema kinseyi TaxID=2817044 RepID=UPI00143CDD48|nr:uncharacterized protein LOC117172770 [Belonocnema kinseyi]
MKDLKNIFTFSVLLLVSFGRYTTAKQEYYRILAINEGDALEISCIIKDPIKFLYPSSSDLGHPQLITSNFTISREEYDSGDIKHVFRRSKAIHGDTGFYGCLNIKDVRNQKFVKRRPFNLTYVYVQSKKHAFVEELALSIHYGAEGSDLHINCRPTSPDLHVELDHYYRGNRTVLTSDKSVTFNPTYGFELKNATALRNDGLYVCKTINKEGRPQELQHLYKINKRTKINEPKIGKEEADRHIVRGQTLRLKCYIMVTNVTNYGVNWESPMNNRSSQVVSSLQMDSNKLLIQSQITKTYVDDFDEGYYRCLFMNYDTNITKSDETYIKIYDPSFKYMNLTFERTDETFVRYPGDQILWFVEFDAYPEATIKWLNSSGKDIVQSEKFKLFNLAPTIGLLIKNISFNDAGVYSLEASNKAVKKILKFRLEVNKLQSA